MDKQRIEWIDTLKFLGIFAIYLGHLGKSGGNAYLFVFIYHVPLFFFISGFFNKKIELNNYLEYIKTSFKKYMYPYYLFAIVTCIYFALRSNHFSYTYIINIIKGVRNHIWLGLWFFSCLFIVKIMYNFLLSIIKDKRITFVITMLMYILAKKGMPHIPTMTPKWFWNIDSAFFYISFYSLGDLIFNWLKENYKSMYCIVLYCISTLIAFDLYFKTNYFKIAHFLRGHFGVFNSILLASFLILFNIMIAILLSKIDFLKEIGKETMILCGTEQLIKLIFTDFLSLFGFSLKMNNPAVAMIQTFIVLWINYKFMVPIFKKYI